MATPIYSIIPRLVATLAFTLGGALVGQAGPETGTKTAGQEIQQIAIVAEKAAAGTEEVAALSEETTATIHEVIDSTRKLAEHAETLQKSIEKFKV